MKKIVSFFNKFLAPDYCLYCRDFKREYAGLCAECLKKINPIAVHNIIYNKNCSIPVYAVSEYKDPVRSLVMAKHFSYYYTNSYLAELIWRYTPLKNLDFDYLVPVPLHWTRYAQRGFNQSEVIAQKLSQLSGKPVVRLVKRVKKTAFQSLLSSKERQENVNQAFKLVIENKIYRNKKFIIVDDLLTTGATLKNIVQELQHLDPLFVGSVVACRVV